ncbi:nuclear intermediate filament protein [Strongylocentrotus purpuratus]|uniref:B-type nuclear lamin n=1 Tax=Strongylocentrotus purpuratus TaxID=7668 RepID=Q9TX29_STRPU|nr:nuclear intermediate filament protein [Strongylocentrotus purpuratus]AAB34118.1 B-type nuclear lamin [Strongylocentrotus purpuratus, Peptide, 565 aa] [Strongylocentrotus purpuratus]AAG35069.1 B-type nuclear lamin [Strongylocentrotus purpuratus]|eukprot:NP_999665.1 nuclear intermediate filament protein [Strongylocentrotus purpuratus]
MASQTKSQRYEKRSTRTEFKTTSTPKASSSSQAKSLLSPAKISRHEEKEELIGLNDRLATYIDRVRHLELENGRLLVQITSFEETQTRDIEGIKVLYEKELADARKLLDETAGEKAKLQIECGKYKTELDSLRPRVGKLEKELNAANKRVASLEAQVAEKDVRIRSLSNDKRSLEDELNELKKDLGNKEKQLKVAKKQVEEETLLRVDLENRLQSLKEELSFKEQLFKEELRETRTKRQVDMSTIEGQSIEELNNSLYESLQELREQTSEQTTLLRQETESLYFSKLADLKALAERHRNAAVNSQDEVRKLRSTVDDLTSEITTIRAQNNALIARIKDLEKQLRQQDDHLEATTLRDKELQQLRDAVAEQLKDYDDLLNIKLSLDNEISTYRKLLEGEETRLRITTPPRKTKSTGRDPRPTKRRRVEDESSVTQRPTNNGVVAIVESDPEGNFVKLHNNSDTDQALGGWHLKRSVDGGSQQSYKFTAKYVLKAGQEVTVWASGSGKSHSPPKDLVYKNVESWGTGDNVETSLLDASGEIMATRTVIKEVTTHEYREGREDRCSLM